MTQRVGPVVLVFIVTLFLGAACGAPEPTSTPVPTATPALVESTSTALPTRTSAPSTETLTAATTSAPTATHRATLTPTAESAAPGEVDIVSFLPQGAMLSNQAAADLDGDGVAEIAASYLTQARQMSLAVLDSTADGDYEVVWRSEPLVGERESRLEARDVNADGVVEIVTEQSMGAAGMTLYLFAWDGTSYRRFWPVGGAFQGAGRFGDVATSLIDVNGDGALEILGGYGPVAIYQDLYRWDQGEYRFVHTVALTEPDMKPVLETPEIPGVISFSRRGEVWSVETGGAGAQRLTSGRFDTDPVFSPDGAQIAFRSTTRAFMDLGPPVPHGIWVVATDGTGAREITSSRQNLLRSEPSWSPDGHRLAFNEEGNLVVMSTDGTGRNVLTDHAAIAGPAQVHWSPTAEGVLYGAEADSGLPALSFIDPLTGAEHWMSEGPVVSYGWLPDGDRIWYISSQDQGLWIVDPVDDARYRLLADTGEASYVTWSPDGQQVAYVDSGGLWLASADGGGARRVGMLADPATESSYHLTWSPDSTHLLYAVSYNTAPGLWLVSADGKHQWRLTEGEDVAPAWSRP